MKYRLEMRGDGIRKTYLAQYKRWWHGWRSVYVVYKYPISTAVEYRSEVEAWDAIDQFAGRLSKPSIVHMYEADRR